MKQDLEKRPRKETYILAYLCVKEKQFVSSAAIVKETYKRDLSKRPTYLQTCV